MNDILLAAKPALPAGYIDVSVGEPHVVREVLDEVFDLHPYDLPDVKGIHEYPPTVGYTPLVRLLEEKHGGKVIITNGAKQALGACFYALRALGHSYFSMQYPYWALIPQLASMHDIGCTLEWFNNPSGILQTLPHLLLAPNNPDGKCLPSDELLKVSEEYKKLGMPFIHDAAYYTHTYLPPEYKLVRLGDVQIYSISKMLGLSGLRIGYVVCHNEEFYNLIKCYMEHMTVGCSMMSQVYLHDLMNRMRGYPTLTQNFEGLSYAALQESKKLALQISPEVLEVPENLLEVPGMFLWAKMGPKADFDKAQINVIKGKPFGGPEDYVRINLAFNKSTMQNIVNKLNSLVG